MSHQHKILEDTIYFWFGANDTSGSGNDGASPVYDVRLAGAAAGAAPVLSGSAILLTHANYPAGAHEVAVAATTGNGFVSGNTYGVFCTLLVDSQNPTGFIGSFVLDPIIANVKEISDDSTAADNIELDYDGTGYTKTNSTIGTTTTNSDMRGTDNAALASVATEARLAELDAGNIPTDLTNIEADTQDIQSRVPAALVGGRIDSNVGAVSGDSNSADNLELDYDGTGYNKINSTIGTTTANTDMRGTDSAALAVNYTAARAGYLDNLNIGETVPTQAQINSQVDTALTDIRLDHLVAVADSDDVVDNSIMGKLASSDGDWSNYVPLTDALQSIRDRGDVAWITGGGGDATAANQTDMIDKLEGLMSKDHALSTAVGTFDPSTDANEAIRNRGDAAWITGGGVGGSSTVTITVLDQDSNAIPDASVQIWNTGLTSVISFIDSDPNGQAALTADDGNYYVKVRKGGFSFDALTSLTVSGTTTQTITGTSTIPPDPTGSQSCRVYEFLFKQDGVTPVDSVENAIAKITKLPSDIGSVLHTDDPLDGVYDSSTGLLYWDVVRTAKAKFIIKDFGIKVVKTVPDQSTVRLSDMT